MKVMGSTSTEGRLVLRISALVPRKATPGIEGKEMADCCERPAKARSRTLWIILVVLSLMLAAKALWGQKAPLHSNSGLPGPPPSGTSEIS